ncbi:hypothetical protein CAOG_02604 [Capsaspora owczarzaki ATCC 30864]|uniref:Cornichon n=1 Tax=Capsaspora owczarzaki (strain ATCC 30864) TaxID=595528 RepID=A0A0D2X1V6_CAPO3|nr:hypothetical protein CAOG_02604 [Capsaspora owczarzaki ATCC 30864]KJE91474.1 hypothetical protein CAOG_002604 [Capsaspora owczarzaki ATCC 30864]|eukprot:XP_004349354.1 hypothetical protein CAOG_02604 [Capsaspora owczarzaki ATCC 30864]
MVSTDAALYIFAVIVSAALLFLMVYFIIMFSDLQCDYINPVDLCNSLNVYILPEVGLHAFLTTLFLFRLQWLALLLNVPLVAYHAHRIHSKRYLYDSTEVFQSLGKHKQESFIKLGLYLVCFFYYLYSMITALIAPISSLRDH